MKFKPFFPAFIWIIIVTILSGYPGKNLPKTPFNEFDKLEHFGIYAILCFLMLIGFARQKTNIFNNQVQFLISLIFTICVGGIIELLQEYVFLNRYGDWLDFFANTIGAFFGLIVFSVVKSKTKQF